MPTHTIWHWITPFGIQIQIYQVLYWRIGQITHSFHNHSEARPDEALFIRARSCTHLDIVRCIRVFICIKSNSIVDAFDLHYEHMTTMFKRSNDLPDDESAQ